MTKINVLDEHTINQIAAGEVIERPAAVVKELVENSIDAGANAITVEIKEGGINFIRITDNGSGIEEDDMPLVFLRHSTSKIKSATDLLSVSSLGFRGEALSSIAAVAQVELVTKTAESFSGIRYQIEGGEEKSIEHIGCPSGTTLIVRNLFYNTPARRKFLKSPTTEAGYISDLMERLAVSHPMISFKFINNNKIKLHTSGNSNLKDVIYHVYGREIASQLVKVESTLGMLSLDGYIAKPTITRGNRNYENYFINGRYIKSSLIYKAIEDGFRPFTMSHRYPFTCLHLQIPNEFIDVNVHPAKLEIRFKNGDEVYQLVYQAVKKALEGKELIPSIKLTVEETKKDKEIITEKIPEPFEVNRRNQQRSSYTYNPYMESLGSSQKEPEYKVLEETKQLIKETEIGKFKEVIETASPVKEDSKESGLEQLSFISEEAKINHRIVGQVFSTYWIVEFGENMYIIDQHAAHEKVLYEKTMESLRKKEYNSQLLEPPVILTFNMREEEVVNKYKNELERIGFEIEAFGGKEYAIRAVPSDLYGLAQKEVLVEIIDTLVEEAHHETPDIILEKIASISCKAAVKGNHNISTEEIYSLIDQLLTLENPYHCPHGRPTIISMSKYELEKKFKRIV